MHEMYIAGVTIQAIKVFNDLLEIGRTHKERLAMPHIQWAHDLTLELIKSNENHVRCGFELSAILLIMTSIFQRKIQTTSLSEEPGARPS